MAEQKGPSRKILIVEDDESLAKAMAETLNLEGWQTSIAGNGTLALMQMSLLQPDLVLLSMSLPDMSGIEVCKTIKSRPKTSSAPVVFVTSKTHQADRVKGFAAGANGYLTKPFSPTRLIAAVDRVLAGRSITASLHWPDVSEMPIDQLEVYARELKELFEREQVERQALEKAHKRLDELDRLKSAFLGAVTHELLTPFAKIGLPMQVLQRHSDTLGPEQQEALDQLATEIAALHRLISGVVKFAGLVHKQREPQPAYISPSQIIPWAVQPVALLAQTRGVDFRVFASPDLPQVHADPELLGEAIYQMAHNAVKFNLPEGQVLVRALQTEGWVVISVKDTGIGLTPEWLAMLGEPFEQGADALRRGQEGLGLGWTFVRYVAEVHNGWTEVESPGPGRGSTFSLTLPVTGETPAQLRCAQDSSESSLL